MASPVTFIIMIMDDGTCTSLSA